MGRENVIRNLGLKVYLSMRLPCFRMKAFTNNFPIFHNHTSHHGIRACMPNCLPCNLQRPPHVNLIINITMNVLNYINTSNRLPSPTASWFNHPFHWTGNPRSRAIIEPEFVVVKAVVDWWRMNIIKSCRWSQFWSCIPSTLSKNNQ